MPRCAKLNQTLTKLNTQAACRGALKPSETLHHTPKNLHPTPDTLHPTPYTLYLTPYALHPESYTLNPQAALI